MPEFGFPPQAALSRTSSMIGDLRRRAETVQVEAVTGRLDDPKTALEGRTGELHLLEKSLNDVGRYAQAISYAEGRAATVQTSLTGIKTQMQSLIDATNSALQAGGGVAMETVGAEATTTLSAVVSALNARYGERNLFSGDDGDAAALVGHEAILAESATVLNAAPDAATAYADLESAFQSTGGLFETSLHTGGAGNSPKAEVAPGERVEVAVRADEPALRRVLMDIAVVSISLSPDSGLNDTLRDGLANAALASLRSNVDQVVGLSARIGVSEARIADAKARNTAAEATLSISIAELAGRDQFEAANELKALETQLETAYVTTARLSNLNLSNYL